MAKGKVLTDKVETVEIVGTVVELKKGSGQFLVVEELKPGMQGLVKPPSGRIRKKEYPASAVVREVFEETGYLVRVVYSFPVYTVPGSRGDNIECHDFHAVVIGGSPKPARGEIGDMQWVNREGLRKVGETCPANHHYGRQITDFLRYRYKQ